ncbi:MAG: PTS sugar transporter subunit IIC [Endomicrobium sp.]|jgi:PTS system mannose-specific IIC component|nr:PTS sugar transporter subunit IIC [Endomicrobium sp.]
MKKYVTRSIVFLAFISALCSADAVAIGQFMVCRPIFCAPLIGFLMGDIGAGVWIGMITEMIWINTVPIGVNVPVDVSIVSILSTFWMCKYFTGLCESGIWGLILAVPFAYLYRVISVFRRNFNTRIMHWVERGIRNGKYKRVDTGIIAGLFFFVAKAFLFYVFSMFVGGRIYELVYQKLPLFVLEGFYKAWYLLPICGFGAVICNFRKTPFLRR